VWCWLHHTAASVRSAVKFTARITYMFCRQNVTALAQQRGSSASWRSKDPLPFKAENYRLVGVRISYTPVAFPRVEPSSPVACMVLSLLVASVCPLRNPSLGHHAYRNKRHEDNEDIFCSFRNVWNDRLKHEVTKLSKASFLQSSSHFTCFIQFSFFHPCVCCGSKGTWSVEVICDAVFALRFKSKLPSQEYSVTSYI
jgi:hypothetical protein